MTIPYDLDRVHLGDCLELMRGLADGCVDHVVADPQYDERTHEGARTAPRSQRYHGDLYSKTPEALGIDFAPMAAGEIAQLAAEFLRLAKGWVVVFCNVEAFGQWQEAAGEAYVRSGIWLKPDAAPQFTGDRPGQGYEGIAIMHRPGRKRWNGGGKHGVWTCGVERVERVHPTQKPIGLMLDLVADFTDLGDLVLDPFAGSGSTGVACIELGRRFVGVEKDPKYAELANARLAATERKQEIWRATGKRAPTTVQTQMGLGLGKGE